MLPEPGGLLIFGIPDFRLPKDKIKRGIKELEELGVRFHCNTKIGETLKLGDLIEKYDAVIIATGTWKGKILSCPGSDLKGVISAFEWLTKLHLCKRGYLDESQVPKIGKNVVVIGGGEVAMDAARTALREGAEKVTVAYRRRKVDMPAQGDTVEAAMKEGVEFIFLVQPTKILGDDEGKVRAIELVRNELGPLDSSGRPRPIPKPGTEFELECDTVVFAIGERATPPFEDEEYGIKLTRWGTIWTDEKGRTTCKGVFAAGDVVNGPSLIGEAVKSALRMVSGVEEYLKTGGWDVVYTE